jgi:hypothetical protein
MSVAGILSSLSSLQLGAPSATKQGLQQLKQDLQTGNLNTAQSDFAALQKAFSQSCATSAANSPATTPTASSASRSASSSNATSFSQAIHQLASDLTSSNLAAAQKDFSALKQDLPQANGSNSAGDARHHHWSGGGGSNQSSGGTTPSSLFTQLSQALASGNMASAQQAYASLQSQQFSALSTGQSSPDSPMSMLA